MRALPGVQYAGLGHNVPFDGMLGLTTAGLGVGLVVALAVSRLLSGLLYGGGAGTYVVMLIVVGWWSGSPCPRAGCQRGAPRA